MEQFHEAMLTIYKRALAECNYRAKAFLAMVVERGGLPTAKALLTSDEIQSGLYELFECDRLDLTVEALVAEGPFRSLFEPGELTEAERRLAMFREKRRRSA